MCLQTHMNWNCLLDSACALNSSWATAVAESTNWAWSGGADEVCEAAGPDQASLVLVPRTMPCTAWHLNRLKSSTALQAQHQRVPVHLIPG